VICDVICERDKKYNLRRSTCACVCVCVRLCKKENASVLLASLLFKLDSAQYNCYYYLI